MISDYIQRYTSPNENFEYGRLCQFFFMNLREIIEIELVVDEIKIE